MRRNGGAFPFYLRATSKNKIRLSTPRVPKGLKARFSTLTSHRNTNLWTALMAIAAASSCRAAIPSSAGNPTCGGFPMSSTRAYVCICVPVVIISVTTAIRAAARHRHSWILRKTPEVDTVFDVMGKYFRTEPLNYAISFCHTTPRNTRLLHQRASN